MPARQGRLNPSVANSPRGVSASIGVSLGATATRLPRDALRRTMSKSAYPLKLLASKATYAADWPETDCVWLNRFIGVAVPEKVVSLSRTAEAFLKQRAGKGKPRSLLKFTRTATTLSSRRARPNGPTLVRS